MIALFICLFALSASAAVTTYDDAPVRTKYQVSTNDVIEFYDGFICPTGYVFKDQSTVPAGSYNNPATLPGSLDFEYINKKRKAEDENFAGYTFADVKSIDLPQGITFVGLYACKDVTTLKRISFPDSVTSLGGAMFQNATGLEECIFEHNENSALTVFPGYTFYGCKNLKAFSMPDCIIEIDDQAQFSKCTSMTALYLSKKLTRIESGTQDRATFDACEKMYLVNEPFTYDNIPEKPTIYYFPENLEFITQDCVFRNCKNLNDVLVFPDGITNLNNIYMFQSAPIKTVVFLGNMESIATTYWGTTSKLVFANSNDKSIADVPTCTNKIAASFCFAPGNTSHFQNPKLPTSQDATCTESAMTFKTCFCNTKFDITADETHPALGHECDFSTITSIVYTDYTSNGVFTCGCQREGCEGVNAETIEGTHIFTYLGYSRNASGDMCVSYTVNETFLGYYKTLKQENFKFGLLGTVIDFDENKDLIQNEDKPLMDGYTGNVLKADLTEKTGLVGYDMIIKGFSAEHQDLVLAINLYVIDGENTYYIWDGTNTVVNYKQYSTLPIK